MDHPDMAKLFTDIFGEWQRLCHITEDGHFVFQSDGISGQFDYRQDVVEHKGHGMMTLRYDEYYRSWHITWQYANEYGPERNWAMHPQDHHGYRDCQALFKYTCFIEEGHEREALENIRTDVTDEVLTDKELSEMKGWDVENAAKRS